MSVETGSAGIGATASVSRGFSAGGFEAGGFAPSASNISTPSVESFSTPSITSAGIGEVTGGLHMPESRENLQSLSHLDVSSTQISEGPVGKAALSLTESVWTNDNLAKPSVDSVFSLPELQIENTPIAINESPVSFNDLKSTTLLAEAKSVMDAKINEKQEAVSGEIANATWDRILGPTEPLTVSKSNLFNTVVNESLNEKDWQIITPEIPAIEIEKAQPEDIGEVVHNLTKQELHPEKSEAENVPVVQNIVTAVAKSSLQPDYKVEQLLEKYKQTYIAPLKTPFAKEEGIEYQMEDAEIEPYKTTSKQPAAQDETVPLESKQTFMRISPDIIADAQQALLVAKAAKMAGFTEDVALQAFHEKMQQKSSFQKEFLAKRENIRLDEETRETRPLKIGTVILEDGKPYQSPTIETVTQTTKQTNKKARVVIVSRPTELTENQEDEDEETRRKKKKKPELKQVPQQEQKTKQEEVVEEEVKVEVEQEIKTEEQRKIDDREKIKKLKTVYKKQQMIAEVDKYANENRVNVALDAFEKVELASDGTTMITGYDVARLLPLEAPPQLESKLKHQVLGKNGRDGSYAEFIQGFSKIGVIFDPKYAKDIAVKNAENATAVQLNTKVTTKQVGRKEVLRVLDGKIARLSYI